MVDGMGNCSLWMREDRGFSHDQLFEYDAVRHFKIEVGAAILELAVSLHAIVPHPFLQVFPAPVQCRIISFGRLLFAESS